MVLNDSNVFKEVVNGLCFSVKEPSKIIDISYFIVGHCHKYAISNDGTYLMKLTATTKFIDKYVGMVFCQ